MAGSVKDSGGSNRQAGHGPGIRLHGAQHPDDKPERRYLLAVPRDECKGYSMGMLSKLL